MIAYGVTEEAKNFVSLLSPKQTVQRYSPEILQMKMLFHSLRVVMCRNERVMIVMKVSITWYKIIFPGFLFR